MAIDCQCDKDVTALSGRRLCEFLAREVIEQSLSKRKFLAAQLGHPRRDDGNTFICLAALGGALRRLLCSARTLAWCHTWLLPSPARVRRACPLPGQTGRGIRKGRERGGGARQGARVRL